MLLSRAEMAHLAPNWIAMGASHPLSEPQTARQMSQFRDGPETNPPRQRDNRVSSETPPRQAPETARQTSQFRDSSKTSTLRQRDKRVSSETLPRQAEYSFCLLLLWRKKFRGCLHVLRPGVSHFTRFLQFVPPKRRLRIRMLNMLGNFGTATPHSR